MAKALEAKRISFQIIDPNKYKKNPVQDSVPLSHYLCDAVRHSSFCFSTLLMQSLLFFQFNTGRIISLFQNVDFPCPDLAAEILLTAP